MSSQSKSPNIPDLFGLLSSQLELKRLLPAALDISLELTGAERAYLIVHDRNEKLSIKSGRDRNKQNLSEAEFLGSSSIIQKVLENREALYLPELKNSEFASSDSIRTMNLQSAICIPLWRHPSNYQEQSSLLGILYIDSSSLSNPLLEYHLQSLRALGNHIAISIENSELFQELEVRNKELESKNQQIELLNHQLQQSLEAQAGTLAEMKNLLRETQRELVHVYGLGNIIGKSKAMLRVFKILEKIVETNVTVMISGESGTGKELIAKYIHYNGPRAEKPMVSVNCSAFSETLLESELFGHRKGAFTGANENKIGLFQLADNGTLFLDEVGDMSPEMQKKLLRTLQDGEVRPIGSKEFFKVDVRILAATNKNLKELVQQGKFREDLYYRLNVIHISLPSLRERREDIPLLIDYFTLKISEELKNRLKPLAEEVLKRFIEYEWPGNVRELENELRRIFVLESEYEWSKSKGAQDAQELTLTSVEKKAILKALETAHGNKRKAAKLLGIPRSTFYEKLSKYRIF